MGRRQVGAPGYLPREAAGSHGSLLCTIWGMVCGKSDLKCQGHKGQKGQCRCITRMPAADRQGSLARDTCQISPLPTCHPLGFPVWSPVPGNSVLQTCPSPVHSTKTSQIPTQEQGRPHSLPVSTLLWLCSKMLLKLVRFSLYLQLSAWSRQLISTVDWANLRNSHSHTHTPANTQKCQIKWSQKVFLL